MYIVRSDKGVLIAKLKNNLALKVIAEVPGQWVEKNFVSGKRVVYVLKQNTKWGDTHTGHEVYFWEGYYVEQEQ